MLCGQEKFNVGVTMITNIYWLTKDEAYAQMYDICATIFGARNIWMSNSDVLEQLNRIDKMFRNLEFAGYDENRVKLMDKTAEEVANLDF